MHASSRARDDGWFVRWVTYAEHVLAVMDAYDKETRQLQGLDEHIARAYHRVQPAFEKLTADAMQRIVAFVNRKSSVALSVVSSRVNAGIKTYVQTQHVPACKIQKFWRWCKLFSTSKSLMLGFGRTRLDSYSTIMEMGFDALVTYLREPRIVKATKLAVQRMHWMCVSVGAQSSVPGPETGMVNARIFLALYMCVYYPGNVFDGQNRDLEENLIQHATNVCRSFNMLCAYVREDGYLRLDCPLIKQQALGFVDKLMLYLQSFKAWKIPDEARLLGRIWTSYFELVRYEDYSPDPLIRAEFEYQKERLRAKYKEVGGPAALDVMDMYLPLFREEETLHLFGYLKWHAYLDNWLRSTRGPGSKALHRLRYALRKAQRELRQTPVNSPARQRADARVLDIRQRILNVGGQDALNRYDLFEPVAA